ncbi:MAG: hypothetical protein V2A79_02350 [Planctomycetota bacterium]
MRHLNDLLKNLVPVAVAPSAPVAGDTWIDSRTGEMLVWNGTYWIVGDLARVETVVAVPLIATADVDVGWNVPAGFSVVKTAIKLLKAITGAAGGVKVGFGTKVAGDPDKYGLTATLLANAVNSAANPTYNNGAADDLGLTATDAAGAAAGTIAGSGAADVQVMIWMRPLVTLP